MVFRHVDEQARHASQLYEFIGECVLLFLILWFFSKKPRPLGAVSGLFLLGYGIARSTVEFFRVPDNSDFLGIEWLTQGQLLSIPMIIAGIGLIVWAYKSNNADIEPRTKKGAKA
jgi:phosphatidylglycerol:prolipoprotein diacylglycerol transferase